MEQTRFAADLERLMAGLGALPEPTAKPALVVVSGLPGTGKSYFSSQLAEKLPFVILESDALRKILYSPPTYSAEESARLFRLIHRLIEVLIKRGVSVILDATNLAERSREYFYSIAERLGIKLILVWVEAPPELVRERLTKRREAPTGKSDAEWSVYERMKPSVEEIRRKHYVVDTSRDITPVINKIVKEIVAK